jgi:5-methylcytosine-specific restriction enzyme A
MRGIWIEMAMAWDVSKKRGEVMDLPFEVGALYNRRAQIHGLLGGQRQGGISTPKDQDVVIAFTGEAGKSHGYEDRWDDDGVFHYFGEGQSGDMRYEGGNRAIDHHQADGKKLILFQMMGHGKPYRYLGEFLNIGSYTKPDTPATRGPNRSAIVFRLVPIDQSKFFEGASVEQPKETELAIGSTVTLKLVETRKKQSLFRRRLLGVEKECRLTGVRDLRFLRASHIKPWSACESGNERTDGHNGVLLAPHADALFDRGWISFADKGQLLVTSELPSDVRRRIGLNLKHGRGCGAFTPKQQGYLEFHRDQIFEKRYRAATDPIEELIADMANIEIV